MVFPIAPSDFAAGIGRRGMGEAANASRSSKMKFLRDSSVET
jgi:hypothetical protein